MSASDAVTASPPTAAAAAPTAAVPPRPGAKPRAPFRPVRFVVGAAVCFGVLACQYFHVLVWGLVDGPLALAASAGLGAPGLVADVLHVVMPAIAMIAAMVVFFVWCLRQISAQYWAPVLITFILAVAHLWYGVLENFSLPWLGALTGGWITAYSPTFVTIAAAVVAELLLGRLAYGKWINPASAYVTGISAGILIKSPELWPFVLCAVISIASKYALRVKGRHLWNPTNFGVSVILLLASQHTASLSGQDGNGIGANVVIWTLGALILWKIGKLHIPLTFAAVYLLLVPLKVYCTGHPWAVEAAPLTGPMYQLYMCFMITDPKTTTQKKWSQCVVAALVAVAEALFRLAPEVRLPDVLSYDAAYLALFVIGPAANLIEIWWNAGKKPAVVAPKAA